MSGFNHSKPFEHEEDLTPDGCDWEISFFEGIVEHSPNYVEPLQNLGNLYTVRGLYAKGLEIDKRLVKLRPKDAIVSYNLACSLSLVGELEPALCELRKAIGLGYSDIEYMRKDGDLDNLRNDPRFCELLEIASKQA
ncbi:MAG TPA: hypothetical protein VM141_13640 [Planctomycetota bacterium]|nr:hypothetical protein [Planctomycetota bacterium]